MMKLRGLTLSCIGLTLITTLLTACSSEHGPKGKSDLASSVQLLQKTGYSPEELKPVSGWHERWIIDQQSIDVSWLLPASAQGAPVIIYLPGLGENSESGRLWREAWAQAGYAVISLQPTTLGREIYSSREAQAGSFRSLAQRYYADSELVTRVSLISQAFNEARQRLKAQQPGINWDQVIVAGYDIGAQTAAALAGEHISEQPLPVLQLKPVAAILLSPYVKDSTDPIRFTSIRVPVLTATGPLDEDPFNWVRTAGQRLKLWQNIQTSGSYQLTLSTAEHAGFSGSVFPVTASRKNKESSPRERRPVGGMGDPSGSMGGPGGGRRGPGGEMGEPPRFGHGQNDEARFNPRQAAFLRAVTTAFLDATVKRSSIAQTWLNHNAISWLKPEGSLEQKP